MILSHEILKALLASGVYTRSCRCATVHLSTQLYSYVDVFPLFCSVCAVFCKKAVNPAFSSSKEIQLALRSRTSPTSRGMSMQVYALLEGAVVLLVCGAEHADMVCTVHA